jgi:hypothetical protein
MNICNKRVFILNRIDSWFARLSQGLAREKTSTTDNREDIRYAVRKINQYFYAGNVLCKNYDRLLLIFFFVLQKNQMLN